MNHLLMHTIQVRFGQDFGIKAAESVFRQQGLTLLDTVHDKT